MIEFNRKDDLTVLPCEVNELMKKLLSLLFAFVFVLSFAAPILAQPSNTAPAEHQQLEHKKKKKKKKHPGQLSPVAGISTGSPNSPELA